MSIQQNFKSITISIVVLCLAAASFAYYRHHQEKQMLQASDTYETLLTAVREKKKEKAHEFATKLVTQYPLTTYAALAGLIQARLYTDDRQLEEAAERLRWVISKSKNFLQHIARVRLARILTEQQKYDEALALLEVESKDDNFKMLVEEVKGDIYLLKQDNEKAKLAYQAALSHAPVGAPVARIQLKQNDLNANASDKANDNENKINKNDMTETKGE